MLEPQYSSILLNLPIIITLIAFTRYFVGFKTWKNYPTIALILAFYLFGKYDNSMLTAAAAWLFFFPLIIGVATLTRYAVRKLKLNFYARMAFIYTASVLASTIALYLLTKTSLSSFALAETTGLAVFLITTTIDETVTLLFKKGSQEYLRRMVTTTTLGFLGGLLVTWPLWNTFLSNNPFILLIVILIDVFIGLWSGLRLTEYVRFGSIVRNQK